LTPKVDTVLNNLCALCISADAAAIRASAVSAVASVFKNPQAGFKTTAASRDKVKATMMDLAVSEEDGSRIAACNALHCISHYCTTTEIVEMIDNLTLKEEWPADTYRQVEGQLLGMAGILGGSSSVFEGEDRNHDQDGNDDNNTEIDRVTNIFLDLLNSAFTDSNVTLLCSACRSIGVVVSSFRTTNDMKNVEIRSLLPSISTKLIRIATTNLKICLNHDIIEVKEEALYACKQLGKYLTADLLSSIMSATMPFITNFLKSGDPRLKYPAERAARYLLLPSVSAKSLEGKSGKELLDTVLHGARMKRYAGTNTTTVEESSFMRDYCRKHLANALSDSDDEI
jgi:hypothetical protein